MPGTTTSEAGDVPPAGARRRQPVVCVALVAFMALCCALPATADARQVLPADAQAGILALLDPIGFERRQPSGAIVDGLEIRDDHVRFSIHGAGQQPSEPAAASVTLRPRLGADATRAGMLRSRSFLIRIDTGPAAADGARALADAVAHAVQRNDQGGFYREVEAPPPPEPQRSSAAAWEPMPDRAVAIVAVLAVWLGLLLSWLGFRRAGLLRSPGWSVRFRLTHLLPSVLQVVIFSYWALYWRPLADVWAPLIGLEVLFAVGLDLWLGLHRSRRLELGVGAVPIALSTNLFVIYPPGFLGLTLAAITVGLWSKHHLRLPRGHLFNPSALGLTAVGLFSMATVGMRLGDTAAEFSLMPNGTFLVLLLGLVVQWRLGVVLVSIGAFFGLHLVSPLFAKQIYDPSWAPVTLVITLLVTDPATTPRRPLERLLFGLLAGVAMRCVGHACIAVWGNDFYGKVGGVVLANLLLPLSVAARDILVRDDNRLGRVLAAVEASLAPRFRLAHIALFWLLVLGSEAVSGSKAARFVAYETAWQSHLTNHTPLLDPGPERRPDCARNPLFCRSLSLDHEVRGWLARARTGGDGSATSRTPR